MSNTCLLAYKRLRMQGVSYHDNAKLLWLLHIGVEAHHRSEYWTSDATKFAFLRSNLRWKPSNFAERLSLSDKMSELIKIWVIFYTAVILVCHCGVLQWSNKLTLLNLKVLLIMRKWKICHVRKFKCWNAVGHCIYTMFKKGGVELFAVTSSTVNRFRKFFNYWKHQWIVYKIKLQFSLFLRNLVALPCET